MNRQSASDPALLALRLLPPHQPAVLLHSGRFHPQWASRSILAKPLALFRYRPDRRSQLLGLSRPLSHNLWTDLRTILFDPSLPGKWYGYFSYDLNRIIEPSRLNPARPDPRNWPLVELYYCPDAQLFTPPLDPAPLDLPAPRFAASTPLSNFSPDQYHHAIAQTLDYIAAGDIFQANLTHRFSASFTGSPRDLFLHLASRSPAWYGSYLEFPHSTSHDDDPSSLSPAAPPRVLCSTSPELFLQLKDSTIITRPIKGTRPASAHPDQLRLSAKDTAELNMIIDLLRNDLGRVCSYGSIKVLEPRALESHPTIQHTTATITGSLHHSRDVVDLLRATFPGGSITGAPKIRAMQIIDQLEPLPRGPYCGSIGYISASELCLNIAIRTIILTPAPGNAPDASSPAPGNAPDASSRPTAPAETALACGNATGTSGDTSGGYQLDFSVGGGIVADSIPAEEYQETLDKAAAILQTLTPRPNTDLP